MRLFYWNSSGYNFGDAMGPSIVQAIAKKSVRSIDGATIGAKRKYEKNLFALGSIFHMVKDGDVVWGTGVNPIRHNMKSEIKNIDIRAIRGPLSRDYLIENYDLNCPKIYGDPALLLPIIFPELKPNPIHKYGIVPHLRDIELFVSDYDNVILPSSSWKEVIKSILSCELVISSSLHGIIVAEAFGVPARWLHNDNLPSNQTESTFKFNDYYASTNRNLNDWSESIESALIKGSSPPITEFNCNTLLNTFPHDIFHAPRYYRDLSLAFLEDFIRFSRTSKSYLRAWKKSILEHK